MHQKRLEQLATQLTAIASAAGPPGSAWGSVRTRILPSQLVLVDDVADAFDALCTSMLTKEGLGKRFSESHLQQRLDQLIVAFRKSHETTEVEQGLSVINTEHESLTTTQTVHVPIRGIRLLVGPVALGNVTLVPATTSHNTGITDAIDRVLAQTTSQPPGFDKMQKVVVNQAFACGVCAEARVTAEPERARELALAETERGLAILRYALVSFLPPSYRVQIGIEGTVGTERPVIPTLAGDGLSFGLSVPVAEPVEISQDYLDRIRAAGADTLSDIVRKDAPTEFEQALLRAVEWLSDAGVQRRTENQLLSLTTCLEALLTPRGGDPISNAIAEAAAILLADSVAERKDVKRRAKRLYGLRSAVSHGGHRRVLAADVAELQSMAAKLVRVLLDHLSDFRSQGDLLAWIEDEKLSPGAPPVADSQSNGPGTAGDH